MKSMSELLEEIKGESDVMMPTTVRLPRRVDDEINVFCRETMPEVKKGTLLRTFIERGWIALKVELAETDAE